MNILLHIALCWSSLNATLDNATPQRQGLNPPDSLGTAQVTVTRPVHGINTPMPLQRLDSAALKLRGITDTGDALRRMAGVNLRDYGGAGGLKTVSVRGLGAAHTRVAYDGICLNDTRMGQTDLQRFSLDRLEGMELQTLDSRNLLCPVRNLGAATLYLMSPAARTQGKLREGNITLRQASFNTWNPSLTYIRRWKGRTALSTSADYFYADNNYPFFVENGIASEHLHRTNSRMQTATLEANAAHQLKDGKIEAKVFFHHNYRHLPGQVIYYVNENHERLAEQNFFAQGRWTQQWGRLSAFAAAKYNWDKSLYSDINAQYPGGALRQHYWQREAYATAGTAYAFTPWLHGAYATDYAHASMNSNLKTDNDVSRDSWLQSISLQCRTERFQLTARGIFHLIHNHVRGGEAARNVHRLTPSVTASAKVVQRPFNLYVRAGYKESFRMPTFTESYFYHLGSTSLLPELARQWNGGITLQAAPARWWPLLSITADVYRNRVKDRIVSVPYNLFIWRTINIGEVRTTGADITFESRWMPARKHRLTAALNYTFMRSEDRTSPNTDTYGNQLAYTPKHSGGASLSWENPWISVVAHTTFSADRWSTNEHTATTLVPAYCEWGFALWHDFDFGKYGLELRADLINAFNERYEIIRRYPMPGRAYKLSCKWKF